MQTFGLLVLGALFAQAGTPAAHGFETDVALRIRLRIEPGARDAFVADALGRVEEMLGRAGIGVVWLDCGRAVDASCDAPLAAAELEVELTARNLGPAIARVPGARLDRGARRMTVSLARVREAGAATTRLPAAVLAEGIADHVIHAWSPEHPGRRCRTAATPPGDSITFDPRDVVLLAGAILQSRAPVADIPGRERLIIVAPDGRWVSVTDGVPGATAIDAHGAAAMATPGARLTLVHNHPRSRGLSAADILALSHPGVHAVEAVGHDGSLYVARRGAAFRADGYATAAAALAGVRGLRRSRELRAAVAAHFAHLVSLVLHQSGAIEYEATLAAERAQTFRRHALRLGRAVNVASREWKKQLVKKPLGSPPAAGR